MVAIAVAGGTGPVGQSIVDGLVEYGHEVYVFSRSDRGSQKGIQYLRAEYEDIDATSKSLEQAKVATVICAIGVATPETNQAQLNLIRAASKTKSIGRFVISSFDMLQRKENSDISPLAKYTHEAIDLLETTELEYTRVANGWFLDYYGMPHWKSYLHPWINVLSMEKKWAAIPGDGSARAHFVTTQDMGRFVAHLMDLDKWPKISSIVGEELTMDQLVELAEKARGSKFRVEHDSLEKLKSGKISFISEFPPAGFGDGDEAFYAMIHYQVGLGGCLVPTEETLNEKFPHLKTTSAAEVMESWKGR
ncbi:NAD(P)-binding protein [Corynespora cassiicola Philippines]|uniref:NAD(P)-binding protein n=1 Tax=Corynespora cassiicola Philippines TaxID=1448308 RepID=A0A2T2N8I0_CORCC|nr:NAD(P)-binding protein [Corynespora cassiicola Philippines]